MISGTMRSLLAMPTFVVCTVQAVVMFLVHSGILKEDWVHHSQWMAMRREHAALILEEDFTSKWERSYTGDEHYFLRFVLVIPDGHCVIAACCEM